MKERICYIEDTRGGYFCYESDAEYFLQINSKEFGGVVCDRGTRRKFEKFFGCEIKVLTKESETQELDEP